MDNALKGLLMAAGVVMTCMIVGIGFYIAREAKAAAFASAEEISSFKSRIEESGITRYDGVVMTGNEAVNFISDILMDYNSAEQSPVLIKIVDGGERCYKDNTKLYLMRDEESNEYITPLAEYKVRVIRDDNKVISEIRFTRR